MNNAHTSAMIKIAPIPMLVLACFLCGCGTGDEEAEMGADEYYYPKTQNILFYGTGEISLEITPDVAQPSFAWRATGLRYVVITILNSKIDLKDNRIANPEDAVWTWNTGLGKGREGNVSFSDGRDVRYGEIQDTVSPLSPGTYYIAAWGYDDDYDLIRSSKEYQHKYYPKVSDE